MRVLTQLTTAAFPERFSAFKALIGERRWLRRARAIHDEIRGKPFLADYLRAENAVALALTGFSRGDPMNAESVARYDAMTYVSQFTSLYDQLDHSERPAFLGRVRESFENPNDLRAIQFEWLIATHLANRGFDIHFPRLSGSASFDLLATKTGLVLELECKSISPDKGRQVHRRAAYETHHLCEREFGRVLKRLKKGVCLRLIVPARFPNSYADRLKLAKLAASALLQGKGCRTGDAEVLLEDFDVSSSPFRLKEPTASDVHSFLKHDLGIANREVMVRWTPGEGAFVMSLESAIPDDVVGAALASAKDAYERQLSGANAGIICVRFEDLTPKQLEAIASERGAPSALRVQTSRFLVSKRDSHLVSLSFFSGPGTLHRRGSIVSMQGTSYFFPNESSPLFNEAAVAVFRGLGDDSA